jgi:hypothetical protein
MEYSQFIARFAFPRFGVGQVLVLKLQQSIFIVAPVFVVQVSCAFAYQAI